MHAIQRTTLTSTLDDETDSSLAANEAQAARLESTGRFRILRRLEQRTVRAPIMAGNTRIGVIVDTETTGLDVAKDEVIEIAGLAFTYDADGIRDIVASFEGLEQPSQPLSTDVVRLTGLTDETLRGKSIDREALATFLEPCDLIIAHNARFDRPFCERLLPAFGTKTWACSVSDVAWRTMDADGARLGSLLACVGIFHEGHRALTDCHALLTVLTSSRFDGPRGAFAQLLAATADEAWENRAEGAPFACKDILKSRGYRWSPGSGALPKCWFKVVPSAEMENERRYLTTEIFRGSRAPVVRKIDPGDRFR